MDFIIDSNYSDCYLPMHNVHRPMCAFSFNNPELLTGDSDYPIDVHSVCYCC